MMFRDPGWLRGSVACLLLGVWLGATSDARSGPVRSTSPRRTQAAPMWWIPRSTAGSTADGEGRDTTARSRPDAARDSLDGEFRRQLSLLRRYPSKVEPHLRLGEIYFRIGNDYAARHHLERFLESSVTGVDSLRAARLRARCLVRLDRRFEAAVALEQLARRREAPPAVDHDLSVLLRSDHLAAEALMAEMRAVERSGGDPVFLREAAAQWKELGLPAQALSVGEVLSRDPRAEAEDLFQAGYLAHRFGRHAEAAARYEEAIARDPGHAEAHYDLALLRVDTGDVESAVAHWREVLRLRPAYDPTYFQLGTLLLEHARGEEATAVFESYLQAGTDFPALVEAAGILNTLGVPPQRWRALLDTRTEELAAEGRRHREEAERAAAAADSARAAPEVAVPPAASEP